MAQITRYDGNLQAFASGATGTERTVFGDTTQSDALDDNINLDFLRGWGIVGVNENPTKQDFNALGFTHGQLLAYLHQVGVPEWNTSQEYHIGAIANVAGVLYESLTSPNTGNDPAADDGTNWLPMKDNRVSVATITPASDADVALVRDQYSAEVLTLVDGAWTSGHNIIVPGTTRLYWVNNSAGTYDAVVKTAAGTGITVEAGSRRVVLCDATNVIDPATRYDPTLLFESVVSGAAVGLIDVTGLDINTHKSYRIEVEHINSGLTDSVIAIEINGDTTVTNYHTQTITISDTTIASARQNNSRLGTTLTATTGNYVAQIMRSNNRARIISNGMNGDGTTLRQDNRVVRKDTTDANITQITLRFSGDGADPGSVVRVYRGDK